MSKTVYHLPSLQGGLGKTVIVHNDTTYVITRSTIEILVDKKPTISNIEKIRKGVEL